MLNSILAILFTIGPWSLGAILALKLPMHIKTKLKFLFIPTLILFALIAIYIAYYFSVLLLAGIAGSDIPNTHPGFFEILPGRLVSFPFLLLASYYWAGYVVKSIRGRGPLIFLTMAPIIWLVLLLLAFGFN